ncbi:MAG: restriction endonuclease subunit S [Solirubrobacteraceae bacterium]
MSKRRTVALREVLTRVTRPVQLDDDTEYATLGVRWYGAGCFLKAGQRGRTIAAKTLNAVEDGDIVFSRLFAWKGSFGVVHSEHAGAVASNEFPTYRASSDLLPEYFELWASRESVWDEADAGSTGTTANSRNRLSEGFFLDMAIELPTLSDQAAAVEAASAFGAVTAAADQGFAAAEHLLHGARSRAWQKLDSCPRQRVGGLMKVTSGGTPSRQRTDYFGGDIPWVKTAEVAFCTIHDAEEHITAAGLKNSSAKVFPAGTVLIAMYGRGTVGRSAVLGAPMATNQACAALLPCADLRPRFLFHWLWSHYDEIVDQALGTTNLTNISKPRSTA